MVFAFCMGYFYWTWVLSDAVLAVLGMHSLSVSWSTSYSQVSTFFKVLLLLFVIDVVIILLDSIYYAKPADELDLEGPVLVFFCVTAVLVFLFCLTALCSARRLESALLVLDAAVIDCLYGDTEERTATEVPSKGAGETETTLSAADDHLRSQKRFMQ